MESSIFEDLACAGLTGGGRGLDVGGLLLWHSCESLGDAD